MPSFSSSVPLGLSTLALTPLLAASARAQQVQPPTPTPTLGAEVSFFTVRTGYTVSEAVANIPDARFLAMDDAGTLFVSRPKRADIIALRDSDGDGVFETRATFVTDKPFVHGLSFAHGSLWFATTGAIFRATDANADGVAETVIEVIPSGSLPAGSTHWWRSLVVTQDAIYTSIGDTGNISDQSATDRQKIWKFNLDGTAPPSKALFASGIRNTEKLLLRPGTQEVWGFDHGSDWFGAEYGDQPPPASQPFTDHFPPDELNHYTQDGFYGHPFLVGNRIPRPEYREHPGLRELAAKTSPPAFDIPAHWATNGFCFIENRSTAGPGAMPPDHTGDIFVACHGSWNSSRPVGYCIARVLFDSTPDGVGDGKPYGLLPIVTALQQIEQQGEIQGIARARPVDCIQAPDGSVLFSSDQPGRIYRIRFTGTP